MRKKKSGVDMRFIINPRLPGERSVVDSGSNDALVEEALKLIRGKRWKTNLK
jgi:hypothetical protein